MCLCVGIAGSSFKDADGSFFIQECVEGLLVENVIATANAKRQLTVDGERQRVAKQLRLFLRHLILQSHNTLDTFLLNSAFVRLRSLLTVWFVHGATDQTPQIHHLQYIKTSGINNL